VKRRPFFALRYRVGTVSCELWTNLRTARLESKIDSLGIKKVQYRRQTLLILILPNIGHRVCFNILCAEIQQLFDLTVHRALGKRKDAWGYDYFPNRMPDGMAFLSPRLQRIKRS